MTKIFLYIFLIFGLPKATFTQTKQQDFEQKLVLYFQKQTFGDVVITKDSLYKTPFKEKFNVSVSKNCIAFDTTHLVIKNPYFSQKYEDAEEEKDYTRNFPRSFSVIYENALISLFENGKFACFKLDSFARDTILENKLNVKRFKYHWIINGQLGGLSGRAIYLWNGNKWIKYKDGFPIKSQPKLFEDDKFVVYGDCHGEFGGTVYFFEKSTSKIFFTESTCANSVIKDTHGYNVLAHLGHGRGFTVTKTIADPSKLNLAKANEIGRMKKGGALGYTDKSNAFTKKLDFYGIQLFSFFTYQGKTLYIVNLPDLTFIAEIKNNEIEIVNPLFFTDLYTHHPVTSQYGDYTLINLDLYGIGLYREISVLLINRNKITKLDWNEDHSR